MQSKTTIKPVKYKLNHYLRIDEIDRLINSSIRVSLFTIIQRSVTNKVNFGIITLNEINMKIIIFNRKKNNTIKQKIR